LPCLVVGLNLSSIAVIRIELLSDKVAVIKIRPLLSADRDYLKPLSKRRIAFILYEFPILSP
jgi:hypothetical protein